MVHFLGRFFHGADEGVPQSAAFQLMHAAYCRASWGADLRPIFELTQWFRMKRQSIPELPRLARLPDVCPIAIQFWPRRGLSGQRIGWPLAAASPVSRHHRPALRWRWISAREHITPITPIDKRQLVYSGMGSKILTNAGPHPANAPANKRND